MLCAKDLLLAMCMDLGMLPSHLQTIIRTAPLRYKVFFIPKRKGGQREVAQPAREVKAIQRWLISRLSTALPLHESATAYRKGASIRENASRHVHSEYVLKMDFRNFFPSILMSDVVSHLARRCSAEYDSSAMRLIAYACTWAPHRQGPLRLCIGAPSSPLLSNSLLFEFDELASRQAAERGAIYTRYADDLTFSTSVPGVLSSFPNMVRGLLDQLAYPRLVINEEKTVFASRAGRRVITGVTLTNDRRLSIGRERKRTIRAMYHHMLRGTLDDDGQQELRGLIAFAEDIEPGFRLWLQGMAKPHQSDVA
jgi:RNA-directed DNA polymerase